MSWLISKKKWIRYGTATVIVIFLIFLTIETRNNEEASINEAFLENQIEIQQTVTEAIANNISSEIQLMLAELRILSNSDELQNDLGTAESNEIIQKTFAKMNSIAPTAQILATDEHFEVISQVSRHHKPLLGAKLELKSIWDENQDLKEPIIGTFRGPPFKEPEVAIIHPVIDQETKISKGAIMVTLPSDSFFARHGNIYNLESQFIVVLNEDHTYLVGPTDILIGEDFFGDTSQEHFNYNQIQKAHYEKVVSGNPDYELYDYGVGERLNTGHPIIINGKEELFLFVITPTSTIYGEVNQIISFDKIQTSVLIITISVILGVLLFKRTKIFEQEKLATIGQLSSNIAHDMRNPLGAIRSSSKRIETQNKNQNQIISDEVARINRSVKRMSHQVEEVLNYVRTVPLIKTTKSLKEMLLYSLNIVEIPKNIKVNLPENDVTIECDPEKLEIVFINLILNAVQAIGDDEGTITIRLKDAQSDLKLEFENSGPPIPDDVMPKIFEQLFTTKLKGTGLGLSICKNIVEQHQGAITVTSNPVTFLIYLLKRLD